MALSRMHLDEAQPLFDGGPAEHLGLALLRGQLAMRRNNPAAAVLQFHIALRLDPTDREALQGLALALQKLGQADQAAVYRQQFQQWRHLSDLLEKVRQSAQARRDPDLIQKVAAACENVGQLPEARAWYRLALAQDPLDPALQSSLHRVRDRAP